MAQVDVSGIAYFLPILSFLAVCIIIFAVLNKTKIIEQKWLQAFVAIIFAAIFIAAVGPSDYVINISAWFVVFLISLFLLLILMGLVGKDMNFMHKGIGIAFVVLLILMFIISAIVVFSDSLGPFMPWNNSDSGSAEVQNVTSWLYSGRVMGAILLVIVSAIAAWILTRGK